MAVPGTDWRTARLSAVRALSLFRCLSETVTLCMVCYLFISLAMLPSSVQAFVCLGRRPTSDQSVAGGDGDDDQYALRRQPQPSVRAEGEQEGGPPAARYDRRGACHAGGCGPLAGSIHIRRLFPDLVVGRLLLSMSIDGNACGGQHRHIVRMDNVSDKFLLRTYLVPGL